MTDRWGDLVCPNCKHAGAFDGQGPVADPHTGKQFYRVRCTECGCRIDLPSSAKDVVA